MVLNKEKIFSHPWLIRTAIFSLAAFFCFFRLGDHPLVQWDESLHGELALSMIRTGDWLNYYFGGVPNAWFAKPPLAIWSIALSYKILGYNEFALRFPSAVFILISLFYIYAIVKAYKDELTAVLTVLILISVNALIGAHVGRNGETDALLVCAFVAAAWHGLRFADFRQNYHIIYASLWAIIGFWAKGPAIFIIFPGFLAYNLITGKAGEILRNKYLWMSAGIFLLGISSWIWIAMTYGHEFSDRPHIGKNSLETMVQYDLFQRFFQNSEQGGSSSYFYVFHVLDAKLTTWNYVGYVLMAVAIFRKEVRKVFAPDAQGWLDLFAFLSWIFLVLFLTPVNSKHAWYLAPVLPFMVINLVGLLTFYYEKTRYLLIPVALILVINLGLKFYKQNQPKSYPQLLTENTQTFREAKTIYFSSQYPMDRFLYVHFQNMNCVLAPNAGGKNLEKGEIKILPPEEYDRNPAGFSDLTLIARDEVSIILAFP